MTSFSLYRNTSGDVDFLVNELAKQLDSGQGLEKSASVNEAEESVEPGVNVISNLMNTLVKSANALDPAEHAELLAEIDDTLKFIEDEIIPQ